MRRRDEPPGLAKRLREACGFADVSADDVVSYGHRLGTGVATSQVRCFRTAVS